MQANGILSACVHSPSFLRRVGSFNMHALANYPNALHFPGIQPAYYNKRLWREEICALLFPCVSCVILHVLHIPRLFLLSGTSSVLVRTVLQFNNTSEHVFHRLWKHACWCIIKKSSFKAVPKPQLIAQNIIKV